EPHAVVGHPAEEVLLAWSGDGAVAFGPAPAKGRDPVALLAPDVGGHREGCPMKAFPTLLLVPAHLQAVVAMEAEPSWVVLGVPSHVVVGQDRYPLHRPIKQLHPEARHLVELAVALPAVD